MMVRLACTAALLAAATSIALAQPQPTPRPAPAQRSAGPPAKAEFPNLACTGPFAKDTTHARLAQAFGAANVTFEEVPGPEGSTEQATVVFAKDPKKRLEVQWNDMEKRTGLLIVQIKDQSEWIAPLGVRIGTTLEDVVKIHGKAFTINGFGWDLGGHANLRGGPFGRAPGGCMVNLRFATTVDLPERQMRPLLGDRQVSTNHASMKAAKPKVTEVTVAYPTE